MPITNVHRISAASPEDVSGIEAAIAAGRLDPKGIVAIFGKTEGNGLVNDFSRGFANQSLLSMLRKFISDEAACQVCLVMSGGTEGAMAPHWIVFERRAGGASSPAGRRGTADAGSIVRMTRFVVDCQTLLQIAAGKVEVAAEHHHVGVVKRRRNQNLLEAQVRSVDVRGEEDREVCG